MELASVDPANVGRAPARQPTLAACPTAACQRAKNLPTLPAKKARHTRAAIWARVGLRHCWVGVLEHALRLML